ncbi:MAG: hypothetical protein ACYC9N_01885, partial [Thermoanaerobaculia bacterium]
RCGKRRPHIRRVSHTSHSDRRCCFNQKRPTDSAREANNGVDVTDVKGKLIVRDGQIMDFLEVLDRRRYELELVKGSPERFRAASRRKLKAQGS